MLRDSREVIAAFPSVLRYSLFAAYKIWNLPPAFAPICPCRHIQMHPRKIAVKRSSGGEGSGSFRLEGRAFNKLFASTPGVLSSSFHATDVDLVFARVSGLTKMRYGRVHDPHEHACR